MALTKPFAQTKTDDFEEIPEVPDAIKRDQWKRPLIQPKDGGPEVAYTRASTLGKAIDDTYHLNRWEIRAVVLGMSRREELVARAAAIPENEGEYRDALQEIGAEAKTAGGGDRGANIGTALHKLSERRDAGEDLSYLPGVLMEAMDAYGELMADFEVLASETFVACDPLQTAGTFDRVVRLLVDLEFRHAVLGRVIIPAGTILVLDLKTGKLESDKYWGPTYGVQQVVYACGDPYTGKGRMTWEELLGEGVIPSTRWAVLLHVPSDSPKDAGLVIVDLDAAAEMADLCLEIRAARKNKGLMSDAFPVKPKPAAIEPVDDVEEEVSEFGVRIAAVLGQIATAVAEADFDELYELNEDIWTDEFTAAVKARILELEAEEEPCNPCPHGGTHGTDYCRHCEQNTGDDEGLPYCSEHGEKPEPTDLLTQEEIEVEVPAQVAQVRKTGLIASLRYAKSEAVIEKIWEQNQDIWDADCNRMVKARLAELEAESVPA